METAIFTQLIQEGGSYHDQKVKAIKEGLRRNKYPPVFNPEKWKRDNANCYAYALNIDVYDRKREVWLPGCIADEWFDGQYWTKEQLIENLKKDLDFLEISYREDSGKLQKGEWRIAVYWLPSFCNCPSEFHFVRQDSNGSWSEKPSWTREVRRINFMRRNTPPDLRGVDAHLITVLVLSKK